MDRGRIRQLLVCLVHLNRRKGALRRLRFTRKAGSNCCKLLLKPPEEVTIGAAEKICIDAAVAAVSSLLGLSGSVVNTVFAALPQPLRAFKGNHVFCDRRPTADIHNPTHGYI